MEPSLTLKEMQNMISQELKTHDLVWIVEAFLGEGHFGQKVHSINGWAGKVFQRERTVHAKGLNVAHSRSWKTREAIRKELEGR